MHAKESTASAMADTSHSLDRIRALLHKHSVQRAKLVLRLDGIKGDSRFSSTLTDLLQREDAMASKAEPQAQATLDQQIQAMLYNETRRYFVQHFDQTQPHRLALLEQQQMERRAALQPVADAARPQKRIGSNQQLLDEELRLHAFYAENYHNIEQFNLDQAFSMQNQRLSSEWERAESKLNQQYNAAKGAATATQTREEPVESDRWHSKEKQQRLKHTAPVLTPDVGAAGMALSRRKKTKQAASLTIMNPIDAQYMNSLKELKRQEQAAKRWLTRQEARLRAQLDAAQEEQHVVGRYLQAEYQDVAPRL